MALQFTMDVFSRKIIQLYNSVITLLTRIVDCEVDCAFVMWQFRFVPLCFVKLQKHEGIMIQFSCYYETGVKPKVNCKS